MKNIKLKKNKAVYTLGPVGTDAYNIARRITNNIELCDTFPSALKKAYENNQYALICCGYLERKTNYITDSWVDLNFLYFDKMKIIDVFVNTKTMCVAKNIKKDFNDIIIHPATKYFLKYINFKGEVFYSNNKPEAVYNAAIGKYDACIGSKDIVEKFSTLKIIEEFTPQMVWCVYESRR